MLHLFFKYTQLLTNFGHTLIQEFGISQPNTHGMDLDHRRVLDVAQTWRRRGMTIYTKMTAKSESVRRGEKIIFTHNENLDDLVYLAKI